MTHYEKIKAMSVEEMADFICGIYDDDECYGKFICGITIPAYYPHNLMEWLESEVEEDG